MKKKIRNYKKIKAQAAVELAIFGSLIVLAFSVLIMYGQRLDSQQEVKMEAFRRAMQKAYERNASVSYTLKKEGRNVNLFAPFGRGQPSSVSSTATVMWQKGIPGPQETSDGVNYAYYRVNDYMVGEAVPIDASGKTEIMLPQYTRQTIDLSGKKHTVKSPVGIYDEESTRSETYTASTGKKETPQGGIVNTAASDLQDTIHTKLRVRADRTVDDARLREAHAAPLPKYSYEEEDSEVKSLPEFSLGAYQRGDINRVGYRKDKVGTVIHREKEWQTTD